jgi:tetratricopeptide (TPR) repeat protein
VLLDKLIQRFRFAEHKEKHLFSLIDPGIGKGTRLALLTLLIVPMILPLAGCVRKGGTPAPRACSLALAALSGDSRLDREIARLQQATLSSSDPARALERLGWAFVEKARRSYDPGYYKLAESCAECLESKQQGSADALLIRGHALASMHRFKEAEDLARQLVSVRELHFDYGLLGDALMEQGRLKEAIEAYQRMIDLKPGPYSYSRAANIRWLKGDLEGALEMIRLAVKATGPNQSESAAWNYSRLAMYELQAGELASALEAAEAALELEHDYAPALLARGRVLMAERRYAEAVEALKRAASQTTLPEFQWALAEALTSAGKRDEAVSVQSEIETRGAATDPRTVALYLATRRDRLDLAVVLAQKELQARSDVFTLDAAAWALSSAGRIREARDLMTRAVVEGTHDARLFYHAGTIAFWSGERFEAKSWLSRADRIKQMLLPSEREGLSSVLAELRTKRMLDRVDGRTAASR